MHIMKLSRLFATVTLLSLVSATAQAQLLKLIVKDKTQQEGIMLINHGEFLTPTFDDQGVWTYDSEQVTKGTDVSLMSPAGFIPAYIEPGKTICVEIVSKDGQAEAKYTGDNVEVALFLKEYMAFTPERRDINPSAFEDMEIDSLREEAIQKAREEAADTISFEEAYRRLDLRYAQVLKAAKAIKNPALSEECKKDTRLLYLHNRITLTQLRDQTRHIDLKTDRYYQQLLGEIDPNDASETNLMYNLPQTFIDSKLTTSRKDIDQTAYALDNVANIEKYITDETVRHKLLSDVGMHVFNGSYSGQVFEMDKFWPAFKKAAPQQTLDYFQPIYDSRMATQAGQPCPDVSFSDLQGQKHKLSDYFGKYIYIDIWATWCGPCCAEIPYIEQHVAHYKDNPKILFLSISIDNNHNAWVKKLEKDKPQWPQFICDKEEQKTISTQWGVTGIPRFIIINPDGTINNAEAFRPSTPDFRERIDKIIGQ